MMMMMMMQRVFILRVDGRILAKTRGRDKIKATKGKMKVKKYKRFSYVLFK